MPSDDLIKFFMKHTDQRFDKLESKVDRLVSFRWLLIGISIGVSGVVSAALQIAQAALR